jgi:hypothetical protein
VTRPSTIRPEIRLMDGNVSETLAAVTTAMRLLIGWNITPCHLRLPEFNSHDDVVFLVEIRLW